MNSADWMLIRLSGAKLSPMPRYSVRMMRLIKSLSAMRGPNQPGLQ